MIDREILDRDEVEFRTLLRIKSREAAEGTRDSWTTVHPFIQMIRDAGFDVTRFSDLEGAAAADTARQAVPALLQALGSVRGGYPLQLICSTLGAVRKDPRVARGLVDALHRHSDPTSQWDIAEALRRHAGKTVADDLVSILDLDNSPVVDSGVRGQLLESLAKADPERARRRARAWVASREAATQSWGASILGVLGDVESYAVINELIDHQQPRVRHSARKALRKLDRARERSENP